MYKLVSILSILVRQFLLPNPYERIFSEESTSLLFNLIIGGLILHFLSYTLTGIFYNKGEAPSLGSIMYLLWYIINTAIITVAGMLIQNVYWLIIILIITYLIIYIVLLSHKEKSFLE
jgi:hypothetical protein